MANNRNTYRGADPLASGAGGVRGDCTCVCGRAPPCRGIDVRSAGAFDPAHILLKEVSCPPDALCNCSHWFQDRGELRLYRSRYSSARRDCIGDVNWSPRETARERHVRLKQRNGSASRRLQHNSTVAGTYGADWQRGHSPSQIQKLHRVPRRAPVAARR